MTGVRMYIGSCGSGKTFKLQQDLAATWRTTQWRMLVVDINGEIGGAKGLPAFAGSPRVQITRVHSLEGAAKAFDAGRRLVAYRPAHGTIDWNAAAPFAGVVNDAARFALEHAPMILVLPEVHQSCPEGQNLPPHMRHIAHHWRHLDVHVWADTQNFAHVKKELVKAADVFYLFSTGSQQDRDVAHTIGGRELADALLEMSGHVVRTKEAGWHLNVKTAYPVGPWIAKRFTKGREYELPLGAPYPLNAKNQWVPKRPKRKK
jgi:hypothetical protein